MSMSAYAAQNSLPSGSCMTNERPESSAKPARTNVDQQNENIAAACWPLSDDTYAEAKGAWTAWQLITDWLPASRRGLHRRGPEFLRLPHVV
jgi:hypothetical protein